MIEDRDDFPSVEYMDKQFAKYFDRFLGRGKAFPLYLFKEVPVQEVECVPKDINGLKVFKIRNAGKNWRKKVGDRRYFKMSGTNKKNNHGKLENGKCQGNYYCPNNKCVKLLCSSIGQRNHVDFKTVNKRKYCVPCGQPAKIEYCGCHKRILYNKNKDEVTVYHMGQHSCTLKLEKVSAEELPELFDLVGRKSHMTPAEIQKSELMDLIAKGQMEEAQTKSDKLSQPQVLRRIKEKVGFPTVNSFEAVAALKEKTHNSDPYWIYKINQRKYTNDPDYVFMTSTVCAKIGLEMDISSSDTHPLVEEPCYFDGVHGRLKGMMSLALWVYHPGLGGVVRLANMYTEKENLKCIQLFWELWNEVLQDLSGDSDYKFNPCYFMSDEAGANMNAVEAVFGEHIRQERVVTCQWHFMQNVRIHSQRDLPEEKREEFKELCQQMMQSSTVSRLKKKEKELKLFSKANPKVAPFVKWWTCRKKHIAEAYRGSKLSGLNLAEVGNSKWTKSRHKRLVKAVLEDLATNMWMEKAWERFDKNTGKSLGRGPSQSNREKREQKQQWQEVQEFIEEMDDIRKKPRREMKKTPIYGRKYFKPTNNSRHKAPAKKSGSEGSWKKLSKSAKKLEDEFHSLSSDDSSVDPSPIINLDRPKVTLPPQPASVKKLAPKQSPSNKKIPHITFLAGRISRCQGCKGSIDEKKLLPPWDLIFRVYGQRTWFDHKQLRNRESTGQQYFHLNFDCVEQYAEQFNYIIQPQDITMERKTYEQLSDGHLDVLHELNFLGPICNNLEVSFFS